MRVALVTDGIWPYVLGGMQKHSYYLCKYLAANGVQVDLFHYNNSSYKIEDLEFFTEQERTNIRSVIIDFPSTPRFPGHYLYRSYLYSKQVYRAMVPTLGDYNFIYTKGFSGWYLLKQKSAGRCSCAPIAVKFHGYEMFQKAPDSITALQYVFLLRTPVKKISLMADYVFSYGGKITDLIKSLGVNTQKIIELPAGIEAAMLSKQITEAQEPLKFLFLGRYERRKGIEELGQAIAILTQHHPELNFNVSFIGPIPEEKKIKQKNIVYLGEIRNREELLAHLRNHDVLVCPSWSEGMPNVILEAMATGLSVIATDVGASNLLVNASTGWLLTAAEPQLIAMAMKDACTLNKEQLQAKKQAALQHITQHFTWQQLSARFLKILAEKAKR